MKKERARGSGATPPGGKNLHPVVDGELSERVRSTRFDASDRRPLPRHWRKCPTHFQPVFDGLTESARSEGFSFCGFYLIFLLLFPFFLLLLLLLLLLLEIHLEHLFHFGNLLKWRRR